MAPPAIATPRRVRPTLAQQHLDFEADRSRRRRIWRFVWILSAAALVALIVWSCWFPGRAFDPVAWDDERQAWDGVRLEMADRLIARDVLSGMTRAKVVAMLGEPSRKGYFPDWDLVYWLGPERGFGVDSEWLVVRISNDSVVEYRIVRD
jgi:hypothetical protein